MNTVQDVLLNFDNGLKLVYDKQEIDSIKYLAVSEITQLSKAQLKAFPDRELSAEQIKKLADILQQLQTGEPLQYILGNTEFYGLPFIVTPAVLIPRPETEELVQWVIQTANEINQVENILDIGTGSGCIPITLKKHLPSAQLFAIDISTEALSIAQRNAELNKVEVRFMEADIFLKDLQPDKHYSIIVSNPPYVTQQEKTGMHINVLNHEPHLALFVENDDPLIFYRAIAEFALRNLEYNGLLFLEINENLGGQTVELLSAKGFKNIELRPDMRGKDRMIKASLSQPIYH